jgi:hypothetical protein
LLKSAIGVFLSFGQRCFILSAAHFGDDLPLVSDDEFLQFAVEPAEVGFAFLWPFRRFDRRQHLVKRFDHDGRKHWIGAAVRFMDRPDARNRFFQSIAGQPAIQNHQSHRRRLRRV